jgi:hypothetical protein
MFLIADRMCYQQAVQQHILQGSSPLTFKRPEICPPEVMNLMENIFKVEQAARPTFEGLKTIFIQLEEKLQSNKGKPQNAPVKEKRNVSQDRFRGKPDDPQKNSNGMGARSKDLHNNPSDRKPYARSTDGNSKGNDRGRQTDRHNQHSGPNVDKAGGDKTSYGAGRGRSGKSGPGQRVGPGTAGAEKTKLHPRDPRNSSQPDRPRAVYKNLDKDKERDWKILKNVASEKAKMMSNDLNRVAPGGGGDGRGPQAAFVGGGGDGVLGVQPLMPPLIGNQFLPNIGTAPPPYWEATASGNNFLPNPRATSHQDADGKSKVDSAQGLETEKLLDTMKSLQEKIAKLELNQTVNKKVEKLLEEKERKQKEQDILDAVKDRINQRGNDRGETAHHDFGTARSAGGREGSGANSAQNRKNPNNEPCRLT